MLLKLERRFHQWSDFIGKKSGEFIEVVQLDAVAFFQLRFVIPGIDLAGTAIDEQPNNCFCLGREMRLARRQGTRLLQTFSKGAGQ